MSDTEQMVRLMEHGAEKLRVSIDMIRDLRSPNTTELLAFTATVAAMAYARGVLQMVSASVAPEGRRLAQRLQAEYTPWADANNEIGMSDGELAAVARFLVGAAS